MNYVNNYYSLIESAQSKKRKKGNGVYYEEHHIIPKSLGGTDKKNNLVLLTPREHYLAHYLLWKFSKTKEAVDALASMTKNPEYSSYVFSMILYDKIIQEALNLKFKPKASKKNKRGSKFDPLD